MFGADEYLKRLEISNADTPTLEFLCQLHFAHLLKIPYENFDIINRINFSLDEEDLFEKIIRNNRGGFCYELIILFGKLLTELGFKVDLLSARIFHQPDNILGPEYDHSVLLVTINKERWLTDVGNSLWFVKPIRLINNEPEIQNYQDFRIVNSGNEGFILMEKKSGSEAYLPQYYFELSPRSNYDFNSICHYKWTSPESKFTKEYICSRVTETGRVTLKSSVIEISEYGLRNTKEINSKEEFEYYFKKYFDDTLSADLKNYKLKT